MKRQCEGWQILPDVDHLVTASPPLFSELEKYMDEYKGSEGREELLDFYFTVRNFLNIYERVDEHYRIYTELTESGDFKIKLLCVNPIMHIGNALPREQFGLFSATLLPIRYYRQLLSNDEEDYTVYVNSPFSQEHRLLLAAADVTSRYTRRNRTEYRKILDYIRQAAEPPEKEIILFFSILSIHEPCLEMLYDGRIGRPDFADGSDAQKLYLQDSGLTGWCRKTG